MDMFPLSISQSRSFILHDLPPFVLTGVTGRVLPVKQDLISITEHMSSLQV
jgi:hypothetical protein